MQTMNDEKGKRIGVRRSLAVGTIRDTLMIYVMWVVYAMYVMYVMYVM